MHGARRAALLDDGARKALIVRLRAQGVLSSRNAPRVEYPTGKGLTPSGEPRPDGQAMVSPRPPGPRQGLE